MGAMALVVLTVWLSAKYLRIGMDKMLNEEKALQAEMEFTHKKELLECERRLKRTLNKLDMACKVLYDVQAVHQGVDSYMQLLLNSDLALPKSEWDMMCAEVRKKSNLLNEIVDCSLEVLHYESLADVPRHDEVAINSFCQDMFEACTRYLRNNNIDLSIETSLPDDYTVCTNMSYLRKLLKNLLICAMEYTDVGYIKLLVAKEKHGNRLRFMLNDTGTGIPEGFRDTVFDRIPNDIELRNKIIGVRLRICRALCHLLGGSIYVAPNYSPGTSIVFTIKTK